MCPRNTILQNFETILFNACQKVLFKQRIINCYNQSNQAYSQIWIDINNMQKQWAMMDEFRCLRSLGAGSYAKVKLAQAPDGRLVAIKKFKELSSKDLLKKQLAIMTRLSHPNVVNVHDIRQKCTYRKKNGSTYECLAIIMDYVAGGELFQFLARTGRFSEEVCRTLFLQLLDGLEHIHNRGVAHRDLKPQNILFDSAFSIKIADFGLSCRTDGGDGSGWLNQSLGTQGYKAPQVSTRHYKGQQADIFSLGVILFNMYTCSQPFDKADPRDFYYKMHMNNKQDAFWASQSKKRAVGFYSQSFKDLINRMFSFKVEERPTLMEIRAHEWVVGDKKMPADLYQQLWDRKVKVDREMEEERQTKKKAKGSPMFIGDKFR